MINEFNLFSAFWLIFSFSFLTALTGAMAPGPLFTYTIIQSVKARKRGYLTGAWVIAGHAILEMGIVVLLLSGFSFFLKNLIVVRSIGIIGGTILIWFGISILRDVWHGNIDTEFREIKDSQNLDNHTASGYSLENPVIGGIMISMSNPYWWVWWATVGFAFMIEFDISFKEWHRLAAFFLGHEAGDLIWYLLISVLAFFGLRKLNQKVYYAVLISCGIFMILFGGWLGISPFFKY